MMYVSSTEMEPAASSLLFSLPLSVQLLLIGTCGVEEQHSSIPPWSPRESTLHQQRPLCLGIENISHYQLCV